MGIDPFDLSGKVALVTGASRGIGEAIAQALAEHGAHTIVSSRKLDSCQTVADQINAAGYSAEAFACHTGEMSQIEAVFAHIDATHGNIDILVNNAATNPYFGPALDMQVGAFEKTVDVNLRGYFFMSTLAARRMRDGNGGSIVNVSSVNAKRPMPNQAVYSMTKAAVLSMTRAFAREWGSHNIRVNALLPGITETKFAEALHKDEELMAQVMPQIPAGRIGQPIDMAGAVLYLVSDLASYVTGSTLLVDGGMLA